MKKLVIFSVLLLILGISGCGQKLIDDGNGHKQFKDNNGNFIKNDWAEINGKYYYFDMNGYLVTNQWVQDEYYVDDKGVMQTDYWYDDKNGNIYYLGKDGKYTKDTIATIDNNEYAFNPNGVLVKNEPYVKDGVGYFFGNDGKIDKTEGYKSINGTYCYVKDDGALLVNDWKEDEGKWYYFNDIGLMLKNSFVEGGYYVDENGKMVKNRQIQIGKDIYVFNNDGTGTVVQPKRISLVDIKNKCCSKLSDGTPVNSNSLEMLDIKVTPNELDIKTEWPWKSEVIYWAKEINRELGLPSSLSNRISKTEAKDGTQTFTQGNTSVIWKVTNERKIWSGGTIADFEITYNID